ncbi:unnamed protein product [Chironomus riparius]|uniref:Uncharacterized protein n=1 Tax=Chironomus riparius TaxID=315576 RepID=A0A9N9RQ88_9DIPT|nr:unnamed protein product [Chironomus riparius]
MKFLIMLFAIIAAVFAIPQHYGGRPSAYGYRPAGGFSGSASNAQAGSQSFNTGGGFSPYAGGFGGSNAFANAGSQSFGFGR